MKTLRLSEFSLYPTGNEEGQFGPKRFREDFLQPALNEGKVKFVLDRVNGLPISFIQKGFSDLANLENLQLEASDSVSAFYLPHVMKVLDKNRRLCIGL